MMCASKDCWLIGCIDSGGWENVWCNGGFCKIVCIWIICGICCSGGGCWVMVSVGFFPPINLSWLRALYMRVLLFRIPIASSNDASVRERAKLTCLVLRTIKAERMLSMGRKLHKFVEWLLREEWCFVLAPCLVLIASPYTQTGNNKSVRKNLIIFYKKCFRTIKTELVRMPLGEIYGFHTAS